MAICVVMSSDSKSGGARNVLVNIPKQMCETMTATLAGVTASVDSTKAIFESFVKAKTGEVNALTEQIKTDKKSIGDLGLGEWEVLCKPRSEELVVSVDLDYRRQWCFGIVKENIHRSQQLHAVGSHTGQHKDAAATLTKL